MLTINKRFHELLPPLKDEEYERLDASIQADGIRDPIILWGTTIVDGHNRYEIAQRRGISFQTVQKEFEDEDDACIWIIENQIGKRNLSIVEHSFKLGELYKLKRKKHGGDRRSEEFSSAQNAHLIKDTTAETVAKEQNINQATVRRAADFHTAVTDNAIEIVG